MCTPKTASKDLHHDLLSLVVTKQACYSSNMLTHVLLGQHVLAQVS